MLKAIEGVIRGGKVELLEPAGDLDGTRVVVTFLPKEKQPKTLGDRGIDQAQAADLRARLSAFAEDWSRPEMDVYDED